MSLIMSDNLLHFMVRQWGKCFGLFQNEKQRTEPWDVLIQVLILCQTEKNGSI